MPEHIWRAAYCRWYDHREAGHRGRAAVWGWIADRLCNALDRLRLWDAVR